MREREKFEQLFQSALAHKKCEYAVKHKCFLIDPSILDKNGIDYVYLTQKPGEMVFTLYGAYHWGFNEGLNVCESSNLASPKYKEIYQEAKTKMCDLKKCNTP